MPAKLGPHIRKICPWCQKPFTVTPCKKHQRCCSKPCHGHWCALNRGEQAFRAMGKLGGTRAAQSRRRVTVGNFLTCVQGSMKPFGTALYLLGFMHGQNTVLRRMRKKARRG